MSEEILKALIQLFALVAFPRSESSQSRRHIVKSFLNQQLNSRLVEEYLALFDKYHEEQEQRLSDKNRFHKRLTGASVKVLKIATGINEALTYYQKIIVLIQLIEFLNIDLGMSDEEREFIDTVALTFNLHEGEYESIINFILTSFKEEPSSSNTLLINTEIDHYLRGGNSHYRHLYWDNLSGELRFLHIESINLFIFRYDGSMDLLMNSQLIHNDRVQILNPGSSLRNKRIDTIFYSDILGQFASDKVVDPIEYKANHITYYFDKKSIGLRDTSFSTSSGKLVGIMGGSGAGKSTLVNVLSGINKPTSGQVLINGVDIHQDKEKTEGLIGYVAQDDLLIEDLSVYKNLYYNAKLCYDNLSEFQIRLKVMKLLRSLGLYEIRKLKVGSPLNKKISGGQRKRLNIALELIREPAILFLDEPTSGLSSRDSENIMDLLKELAIKGKLVFVVIHQPSSDIFKMFNQLLVLDTGGYLIYNGDPVESVSYFKACINHVNRDQNECPTCGNINVEQILNIVNSQVIDEYGNFTQTRKIDPKEWYNLYNEGQELKELHEPHEEEKKKLPAINFRIPNRLKQWNIFLKRDVFSKLANKQYLLINFLETPILALLLASIIKYYNVDSVNTLGYTFANNPNIGMYIIMAVIIAIFTGLTVSAEEIINDKKILKRESFLNLSRFSYLFSKFSVLTAISAVQTLTFTLIGNYIVELKGMSFEFWAILFSSSVFANILGLNISDSFKKTVNIYIIIPFLVIPQLILSGVFVSYDRLNPNISSPEKIPWYGEIITARWAFEALAVNQFIHNDYEKNFYVYDKLKSQSSYRKEYWIPAIQNKLDKINRYFSNENNNTLPEWIREDADLINNELSNHIEMYPDRALNYSPFKVEEFSAETYKYLNLYLSNLKGFYVTLYNKADKLQDKKKFEWSSTPEKREEFLALKNGHFNNDMDRFLRNTNNFFSNKVIEFKGRLWQKVDPIFQDPSHPFLKAHFLSPTKRIGNWHIDTFYANLLVIWLLNTILFISLYYKGLSILLNIGSKVSKRFQKKSRGK